MLVEEAQLAEAREVGMELGDIEFLAVDAERIGSLIAGANDAEAGKIDAGGFM